MKFPGEFTSSFGTGIHVNLRNDLTIYGTEGSIHISDPWKVSKSVMTVNKRGSDPQVFEYKSTNDELYAIEADTVAQFLEAKECPYMTVQDTIDNMKALDMLRKSAGLHFAMEAAE